MTEYIIEKKIEINKGRSKMKERKKKRKKEIIESREKIIKKARKIVSKKGIIINWKYGKYISCLLMSSGIK